VRLSIVIVTLQVLGQTVLGFKLSIAQVLVSMGTSVFLDGAIVLASGGGLRWPASAMLTGNGVALILRVTGTRHGDWWSLRGAQYFVLAAALGILSKHLVRPGGRHIFNPSNLGLVLCLLVVGPTTVFPQYLWWGPLGPPVVAAWAVILVGAAWVLRPLGMGGLVLAFLVPFGVVVGLFAANGACFDAVWRVDSVCGANYWIGVAISPEVAIFVLFMMSDPRTAPHRPGARVIYGMATAAVASALIYIQPTEYGIKLSILAALTIACAGMPLAGWLLRWTPRQRINRVPGDDEARQPTRSAERPAPARRGSVVAAAVITLFVSGAVVATAGNQQLIDAERGAGVTSADTPRQ
jgi:hypothetical protein